jgi:hypothetical protein
MCCTSISLALIQATSNEITFNIICRRSTIPKQSKHSSQIMCLSDNMENNPQKQFIILNAGETEQILKVYEIQLKLLTVQLIEVIFSTYTISYSQFPLHIF